MNTKKLFAMLLAIVMTAGLLAGCGSAPSSKEDASSGNSGSNTNAPADTDASGGGDGEEKVLIGFSLKTVNNPFVVSVKNGAAKAAEDYGAELIITDAQLDSQKQMADLESFMQQKVDVILIDALDSSAIIPTITDAYDAGFKIMTEDVRLNDAGDMITTHVGIDNKASGEIIAQYLVDKLKAEGKKNVVIFEGLPGAEATLSRAEGFHAVLDNDPDINILYNKNVGDQRTQGLTEMDDVLQQFDHIDAVICCNDELALGAISSIEGAGREGIYVTGFDGNSDAQQAVKDGRMLATIDHAPYSMGYLAIEAAVKIARGESVEKMTTMSVELVDSSNIDEIMAKHADEA
nr:sugar ABC transporter substrate-binding protein [uncultured Oscillibacter sp.]